VGEDMFGQIRLPTAYNGPTMYWRKDVWHCSSFGLVRSIKEDIGSPAFAWTGTFANQIFEIQASAASVR
jgi:hypothetical protein